MWSLMAPIDLSDHERSKSRSLGFECLISRNGEELGPITLLVIINRKPYMASPMTSSSLLTLSDLKGQRQVHSDFTLYLVKETSYALCYY